MGAVTSYVGARTRLSTYMLTEFAFGRLGAKVVNLVVALSLVGWFGVISNTLGDAAHQMLLEALQLDVSPYLTVAVACVLMIAVTAMGFSGIDRLALLMVPVMLGLITFAALRALALGDDHGFTPSQAYTYPTAISAVVGSYIAGVIIQPDYSRFACNTGQAVWAVFLALGCVFPVVQFLSAIPSMAMGEPSIILVMAALGIVVPAFFLLFLGAWSSNVLALGQATCCACTRRVCLSRPFSPGSI
jgi:cytosine permease